MAQFDVHRNTGRLRESVPYVVVVQSAQFDDYRRRVVVPLVDASSLPAPRLRVLNPQFTIENIAVVLHPLDLVAMPADQLGEPVGSLADHAEAIACALDEVFTRAWR
jgi:toxin CcdB